MFPPPLFFSFLLSNQWKPQSQCFVNCSWRGKFKKRKKKKNPQKEGGLRKHKTDCFDYHLWLRNWHINKPLHKRKGDNVKNAVIDKHCPVMNCIIFWQDEWKFSVALTFPLNSSNDGGKWMIWTNYANENEICAMK